MQEWTYELHLQIALLIWQLVQPDACLEFRVLLFMTVFCTLGNFILD